MSKNAEGSSHLLFRLSFSARLWWDTLLARVSTFDENANHRMKYVESPPRGVRMRPMSYLADGKHLRGTVLLSNV